MKNRKSFYTMAFIVVAISIAFAFLGITNPLAYPTFIGSFISTDQGFRLITCFLEDRNNKFKSRIGLLGVSEFAYLLGPLLLRMCTSMVLTAIGLYTHELFISWNFSIFSTVPVFLTFSYGILVSYCATYGFMVCLSLIISSPTTIIRVFPLVVGLVNTYPTISAFLYTG